MTTTLSIAIGLAALSTAARADWTGKGELGFVQASGNTSNSTLDAKLKLSNTWDVWKETLDLEALRAATNGVDTAQRYLATSQTDYALTERSFLFGNLAYRRDKFSGFTYQLDASTGYGYKLIDTKTEKLSTQMGVGYGRLQYQNTDQTKSNAVVTAGLDYENALTDTTKVVDKFGYTAGSANQLMHNFLGLEVKMTTALALSVGLDIQHNSNPPAPKKTTDTLTTVNLVFGF